MNAQALLRDCRLKQRFTIVTEYQRASATRNQSQKLRFYNMPALPTLHIYVRGQSLPIKRLTKKPPSARHLGVYRYKSLAMTYSHMGRPHTTIGAKSFHF